MAIGGFKLAGIGQFTQPGVQQANDLLEQTKYTSKEVGWATGANPRTVGSGGGTTIAPKGVTTGGGTPADLARAFASPTDLMGGKLGKATDAADDGAEWSNPFAKPAELGQPTPPPLVSATPVGDPNEWAQPFPVAVQNFPPPSRPPSKLKEGDGDVSPTPKKQPAVDPLFTVAALALGAVLLFL